jgi:glycosyltransferase involved in cell wall biosynthesis
MRVSVVICGYTMDRLEVFTAAIDSVLAQTYRPLEVVIVIDGNPTLHERIVTRYGDDPTVRIDLNAENRGISYSRTRGAELATGEVVAFIDDDAAAEPEWIAEHVHVYQTREVIGVAGTVEPEWAEGRPPFFPAPFYWLVGCTEPGFAASGTPVRNGYGSNVSYRRDAFLQVGGYDTATGRKGERHIQAHEAPVGIKLARRFEEPLLYVASARVRHTLFAYRGRFRWLLFRSFWQGYSKFILQRLYPGGQVEERRFAVRLVTRWAPSILREMRRGGRLRKIKQLGAAVAFSGAIAVGYLWAVLGDIIGSSGDRIGPSGGT